MEGNIHIMPSSIPMPHEKTINASAKHDSHFKKKIVSGKRGSLV